MGTDIEMLTPALVVEVVNDILGPKRTGMAPAMADTPLENLMLDSLDLVEVLVVLEKRCGRVLNVELATELRTVADIGGL